MVPEKEQFSISRFDQTQRVVFKNTTVSTLTISNKDFVKSISFDECSNITIENNTLTNSEAFTQGIKVSNSHDISILNNQIKMSANSTTIELDNSQNVLVLQNTLIDGGISLSNSSNNIFSSNTIENCTIGINLNKGSNDNSFKDNSYNHVTKAYNISSDSSGNVFNDGLPAPNSKNATGWSFQIVIVGLIPLFLIMNKKRSRIE